MSEYLLGPLPWSEDTLRKAYFINFSNATKAIQEHPGYEAHHNLSSLKLSLDVFFDSVAELSKSINIFHNAAQSPEFWNRQYQSEVDKLVLAVRRCVFTSATSALALVDHSRIIKEEFSITEYSGKLGEIFDEEEHRFIQSLRVCLSHIQMIETNWLRRYSESGKQTQFLLKHDDMMQCDNWDQKAEAFMDRHPEDIDINALFQSYQDRVERFHEWFHNEIERISEPELSEYRNYERMLKRFGAYAWWNMIIKHFIDRKLDPYEYIDQYLTKSELDEVLKLAMRSPQQVDKIIEIIDEYDACDDVLRKKIYSAFGVDESAI